MTHWLLIGLALSVPFSGKPTYLTCTFEPSGKAPPIDVAIARSYRTITLTVPSTGHVERQRASLAESAISFDSPLPYGNVHYAIDRIRLSIVQTTSGPSIATDVVKGQCTRQPAPKPAF